MKSNQRDQGKQIASSPKLRKLLGLLGAGIIVATFVAKDVLRDSARDKLSEEQAAGIEFQALIFHDDEMLAIQRGPANGDRFGDAYVSSWDTGDARKKDVQAIAREYMQDNFSDVVIHADVLTQHLSESDEDLRGLRARTETAIDELHAAQNSVKTLLRGIPAASGREKATEIQSDSVEELARAYGAADVLARQYLQDASSAAQAEDERQKRRYDRFTNWSYVLYGAGAGITIWGKLTEGEGDLEGVED